MAWKEAQPAKGLRMRGPESGSPAPTLAGGSGHPSIRKLGKVTPGQAASVSSRAQPDRLLPQLMTWRPLQRTSDVSFWPLHLQHTHALPCTPQIHTHYIHIHNIHSHTNLHTKHPHTFTQKEWPELCEMEYYFLRTNLPPPMPSLILENHSCALHFCDNIVISRQPYEGNQKWIYTVKVVLVINLYHSRWYPNFCMDQ